MSVNKNIDYNFYVSTYTLYPYKNDTKMDVPIIYSIKDSLNFCKKKSEEDSYFSQIINVENFYTPAVRLSSSPIPSVIADENYKDVKLLSSCGKSKFYWQIIDSSSNSGLEFFTFSDKVSPASASYDVLTFYVTFILIIGKLVRSVISGNEAERVIYSEMPRPHKLLSLCEGIKISRYKKDLEREDKLYYILIDLLRSPEMIKMITKSSLQFTQYTISSRNVEEDQNNIPKSSIANISSFNSVSKKRNKVVFY